MASSSVRKGHDGPALPRRLALGAAALLIAASLLPRPVLAQDEPESLIRDTEIEEILRQDTDPIFIAAGVGRAGQGRGQPEPHGQQEGAHGALLALAGAREVAAGHMAGFVGDHPHQLVGGLGLDDQAGV